VIKLPASTFYKIRDPKNFNTAIRDDVELLRTNRAYVSMTTVIMCCIDALAAGNGDATRVKFEAYVRRNFPGLCRQLETASRKHNGAGILYKYFRNGFVHLRGPKAKFAIAEDHELQGRWAHEIQVDGQKHVLVAINVDKLATEFLTLAVKGCRRVQALVSVVVPRTKAHLVRLSTPRSIQALASMVDFVKFVPIEHANH
jgi:hypothetical protein